MGKLKSFRIALPTDEPAFYPGEAIHGQCEIEVTDGELSLKHIAITLRGFSKVHWTESRNVGARLGPYTQHFMSGNEYLRDKKILAQPRMGADRVTLREGKYKYPFSFILPTGTMPSSFEGKYGSTRYWLRAEMSRFRLRHDKSDKTKKTVTFINPINVSLNDYQEPVESAADKTLCCGFCTGGLVSITAHTDKSGYTPGDTIVLSAEFENFTSRRLHPTAALYQRQYYYANDRQKMRTVPLVKFQGPYLSSKCNSTWSNEQLVIPNVTPSITNCSILKVVYFVKISLRIPGSMKLSTILPITLGSNRLLSDGAAGNFVGQLLYLPPYQEATDLPAYDYSTSDEDEDYGRPPSSRNQTPPPCYSDIFDSDDDTDVSDNRSLEEAVNEEDVITTL